MSYPNLARMKGAGKFLFSLVLSILLSSSVVAQVAIEFSRTSANGTFPCSELTVCDTTVLAGKALYQFEPGLKRMVFSGSQEEMIASAGQILREARPFKAKNFTVAKVEKDKPGQFKIYLHFRDTDEWGYLLLTNVP